MKKIVRDYAIIFIDDRGDCLRKSVIDYTTSKISNSFYKISGFLQWNHYLIIPKEFVKDEEFAEEIEKNGSFTRKYVIERDFIDPFINTLFPVLNKIHGTMQLILEDSWAEAKLLGWQTGLGSESKLFSSWARDENLDNSLSNMDLLRARLITEPNLRAVFYTNIEHEYSLACKKFKLFMKEVK